LEGLDRGLYSRCAMRLIILLRMAVYEVND
jgi:hypothetical protein